VTLFAPGGPAGRNGQSRDESTTETSMKRILVTGGAGFLGSHLCERLLNEPCKVICVDDFFTGSRQTISRPLSHPKLEVMRHDITFPLYVSEVYGDPEEHHKPLWLDDPKQCQPDISLSRDRLRWKPKVPLEDGLRETIPNFWKIINV
jgi:nucleoside-diphosphate-sugar epimerase